MPEDIDALERRLEAHSNRLDVQADRIEMLEAELKQKADRIDALEAELERQADKTELLDSVVAGESSAKDKRMGRILQALYQHAAPDGSSAMDARAAWENLNRSVDRTSLYDLFEDIVDRVGNEDVCWVEREERHAKRNTRLVLDLDGGEPPAAVGGVPVTEVAD